MQPRPRHQRGQPLHELQWANDEVRSALDYGFLSFNSTWPAALSCTRSSDSAGLVM